MDHGMDAEFIISEIIEKRFAPGIESTYLKCRLSDGRKVAFWCDYGELGKNIRMIEEATLPVRVQLLDPDYCVPLPHEKRKYGLLWSVPESVDIHLVALSD